VRPNAIRAIQCRPLHTEMAYPGFEVNSDCHSCGAAPSGQANLSPHGRVMAGKRPMVLTRSYRW
jgi:hypothetical protein